MKSKLEKLTADIKQIFDKNFTRYANPKHVHHFQGWHDVFWHNHPYVRKCHLKIIDRMEDRKLWLLHINIFPAEGYDFPILGCDVVSGPNKISGSFFDYSPVLNKAHPMMKHFENETADLSWKRPRPLPDWATPIFSKNMIAAGAVKEEEVDQFCEVTIKLIEWYVNNLEEYAKPTKIDIKPMLNRYCINQKKNDKLHKSIIAMGVPEDKKDDYVNNVLFEEIG